ncbi:glycerophosphodiester phosphodiesterase family protein [Chitinophaga sp. 30R24]|uniref:glycerophosphodiester phosphodiesterase family protein n=1 Tax=Chitinophaga sp. 30R24 TaxID=3248838 RepID=UPI003B8F781A
MKHLFLSVVCFAALQASAQQARPVDAILDEFYHHPEHVMVAAHRAAHTKYPENSLAAMREAIAQGIDVMEMDVRETKDHIMVIMHDDKITRVTGKPGRVEDYTYAELQQFPLLWNGQPSLEKIPAFDEVLQLAKGKIMIDIDFKADGKEAAQRTINLVAAHKMEDQILFFLYDYEDAKMIHDLNPKIPVMPRAHSAAEIAAITQLGNQLGKFPVVHIDDSFYSDSLMQRVTASGTRVWTNALGKYDKLEKANADAGFDQLRKDAQYANAIQTDLPELLLAYLRKKGLHR